MTSIPDAPDPGPFDPGRFFSVTEAADALAIRPKSVRAAIRRRDLVAHRFAGTRGFRLHGADLNDWVHAARLDPPASAPSPVVAPELVELAPRRPRRRSTLPADRLPTTPNRRTA